MNYFNNNLKLIILKLFVDIFYKDDISIELQNDISGHLKDLLKNLNRNNLEYKLEIYIFNNRNDYKNYGYIWGLGEEGGKTIPQKDKIMIFVYKDSKTSINNLVHELTHFVCLAKTNIYSAIKKTNGNGIFLEGIANFFENIYYRKFENSYYDYQEVYKLLNLEYILNEEIFNRYNKDEILFKYFFTENLNKLLVYNLNNNIILTQDNYYIIGQIMFNYIYNKNNKIFEYIISEDDTINTEIIIQHCNGFINYIINNSYLYLRDIYKIEIKDILYTDNNNKLIYSNAKLQIKNPYENRGNGNLLIPLSDKSYTIIYESHLLEKTSYDKTFYPLYDEDDEIEIKFINYGNDYNFVIKFKDDKVLNIQNHNVIIYNNYLNNFKFKKHPFINNNIFHIKLLRNIPKYAVRAIPIYYDKELIGEFSSTKINIISNGDCNCDEVIIDNILFNKIVKNPYFYKENNDDYELKIVTDISKINDNIYLSLNDPVYITQNSYNIPKLKDKFLIKKDVFKNKPDGSISIQKTDVINDFFSISKHDDLSDAYIEYKSERIYLKNVIYYMHNDNNVYVYSMSNVYVNVFYNSKFKLIILNDMLYFKIIGEVRFQDIKIDKLRYIPAYTLLNNRKIVNLDNYEIGTEFYPTHRNDEHTIFLYFNNNEIGYFPMDTNVWLNNFFISFDFDYSYINYILTKNPIANVIEKDNKINIKFLVDNDDIRANKYANYSEYVIKIKVKEYFRNKRSITQNSNIPKLTYLKEDEVLEYNEYKKKNNPIKFDENDRLITVFDEPLKNIILDNSYKYKNDTKFIENEITQTQINPTQTTIQKQNNDIIDNNNIIDNDKISITDNISNKLKNKNIIYVFICIFIAVFILIILIYVLFLYLNNKILNKNLNKKTNFDIDNVKYKEFMTLLDTT